MLEIKDLIVIKVSIVIKASATIKAGIKVVASTTKEASTTKVVSIIKVVGIWVVWEVSTNQNPQFLSTKTTSQKQLLLVKSMLASPRKSYKN